MTTTSDEDEEEEEEEEDDAAAAAAAAAAKTRAITVDKEKCSEQTMKYATKSGFVVKRCARENLF